MKRNVLHSPRLSELKKKRKRAILTKILILVLVFSAVTVAFAYSSHINGLNIAEVQISGNKIADTDALKEVVMEQIGGKYLWLFPKTNTLIYPKNAIKQALQDKFKRLKDINLSIKNNTILEVSLAERVAKYTWCGVESPENIALQGISTDNQKCYFLDEDGYVFDEAPYFSGDVYFKFYGQSFSNTNIPAVETDNPLGFYFSKENFKGLISFKDVIVSLGLKPTSLYATNDGNMEIFLSRENTKGTMPKIIFKADANFQNIAENLEAALNTEPLKSKFKSKYSALQYIDLRFGNKVYDKFSVASQ